MTMEQGIIVAGFAITVATVIWNGSRHSSRIEARIDVLDVRLEGLDAKYGREVSTLSAEVVRVREDRHDVIGEIQQHTGQLGEHGKQLATIDARVHAVDTRVQGLELDLRRRS